MTRLSSILLLMAMACLAIVPPSAATRAYAEQAAKIQLILSGVKDANSANVAHDALIKAMPPYVPAKQNYFASHPDFNQQKYYTHALDSLMVQVNRIKADASLWAILQADLTKV